MNCSVMYMLFESVCILPSKISWRYLCSMSRACLVARVTFSYVYISAVLSTAMPIRSWKAKNFFYIPY
jgi:hypothetical protein